MANDNTSSPSRIQSEQAQLAIAVGVALNAWAHVEHQMTDLFAKVGSFSDYMVAHVIMSSIINFEARLKVLHNVTVQSTLDQDLKDYWNALRNRLSRKAKKRSELAHFTFVDTSPHWDAGKEPQPQSEVRVWPYFSLPAAFSQEPSKTRLGGLGLKEITERKNAFSKLEGELTWLNFEILARQGTIPKNPKPDPRQPPAHRKTYDQTPGES